MQIDRTLSLYEYQIYVSMHSYSLLGASPAPARMCELRSGQEIFKDFWPSCCHF